MRKMRMKNVVAMWLVISIFIATGCDNVFGVEREMGSGYGLEERDNASEGKSVATQVYGEIGKEMSGGVLAEGGIEDYVVEDNVVTERMVEDNTAKERTMEDNTTIKKEETADKGITAGEETAGEREETVDNAAVEGTASIEGETAEGILVEESIAEQVYQGKNFTIEEDIKTASGGFADAANISIGNEVNGSITETNDSSVYKFSLAKSGRVTLDVTAYMRYCSLYIYDSRGELIWYDDGNEWNSNLKYFKDTYVVDLINGMYYLKVTGYRNGTSYASTGTYTFATRFVSAEESCAEPNNDFREASVIGITGTVKGQVAENDAYDIYKFSLSKSGRIGLTMTFYMRYNSLYLYDSMGKEIWHDDWNEWNENLKYKTDVYDLDLASGVYYLKVTGYRNGTSYASTGNYTMKLKYTNANVNYKEPNNDFSDAYAIKNGTNVRGQIAINDPYDVLSFSLPKARNVKFIMTSYMRYYTLAVYDDTGEEIWKTDWNEWNANVGYRKDTYTVALSAGNYYLRVTGYRNGTSYASTGTYTLKVSAKASMAQASVYAPYYKEYTGKAQKPPVTVYCEGKTLRKGRDYDVSYKNNKNIGDATVIVKGKGDYVGTKKTTFLIVPKKLKITMASSLKKGQITVKWKKDKIVTGYQVDMSRKKDFSMTGKKVEFKASKAGGTVEGLSRKKTYYVRVRAWKKVGRYRYYGDWSSVKKVKVK